MEIKRKEDVKFYVTSGLVILTISFVILLLSYSNHFKYSLFLGIFTLLLSISIITRPIKEFKIIKFYDRIFGWILGILYIGATLSLSFLLIYLSIFSVWSLITILINSIIWITNYFKVFRVEITGGNNAVFYISALITTVSISYYGNNVISTLHKLLSIGSTNKNNLSKNIALWISNHIDFRRRCYEISLVLYVLSTLERLSNLTLITNPLWSTYKPVALEVLITFIAIDTYVRNYPVKASNKT